jgi:ABC-type glycerol-3-phosphate transport system substrate-binding protein
MSSLSRGEIDRREFLLLSAGMSAMAFFAACSPFGGGGTTASKGTAIVPLLTQENDPSSLTFYAATIGAFKRDNPDVDVQLKILPVDTGDQVIDTAFRSDTDIGIFTPPNAAITAYQGAHRLLPLSDLVSKIGTNDYFPGTRVIIGGQDWGVAYQNPTYPLYYRMDLFQQVGLNPPKTVDDLIAAAKALNGRNGITGTSFSVSSTNVYPLANSSAFVYQHGADFYARDGSLTFDQPEALTAVQKFAELLKNSNSSTYNGGAGDEASAYATGRAAMAIYAGRLGLVVDANNPKIADVTGVMGAPAGPFMTSQLVFGNPAFYSIYSKTRFPDQAKAFLTVLTTAESALAWALTAPGHLLPPLRSVAKLLTDPSNPLVASNSYMQTRGAWVKTLSGLTAGLGNATLDMGMVNKGKFLQPAFNVCPWASQVYTGAGNPMADMYQQILYNKVDVETAWKAAGAKLGSIAKTYLSQNPNWKPTA